MAYVDLLSSSTSSLTVLGRELGTNQIASLTIVSSSGASQGVVIDGGSTGNYRTTAATFSGLASGTQYGFYITGSTSGGTAIRIPSSGFTYFTTQSTTPARPSVSSPVVNPDTGNVNFSVTTGSNTSHIRIDRSWVSGFTEYAQTSNTTSPYSFVAPTAIGTYTITVTARLGSVLSSSNSVSFYVSAPEPEITSLSMSGLNSLSITWNVRNAENMRQSNSFAVYVSSANSSVQNFHSYLPASARSFETQRDGNNNPLVVGANYTIWLYVYSTTNQSSGASRTATFTKNRPSNFSWTNAKTTNAIYNLTASEWDSFLTKINEFRAFKGLVLRDFPRGVSSGIINSYVAPTANSYNMARNAIIDMNPSISVPPAVTPQQAITAYHFTRIRDALNSIT